MTYPPSSLILGTQSSSKQINIHASRSRRGLFLSPLALIPVPLSPLVVFHCVCVCCCCVCGWVGLGRPTTDETRKGRKEKKEKKEITEESSTPHKSPGRYDNHSLHVTNIRRHSQCVSRRVASRRSHGPVAWHRLSGCTSTSLNSASAGERGKATTSE